MRTPLPFINGQGCATPPAVTPLADGRLLYSGGQTFSRGGVFSETQLYDPLTDGWSRGAALGTARSHHAAVRLPDGTVLAIGGVTMAAINCPARTATVERYAPKLRAIPRGVGGGGRRESEQARARAEVGGG